ncbi:MAG: DUF3820 family protein [Hyphomonadaceae bacterium]|nr:DUF3820 family protein [Hyphomonadaceae bacterium]
MIAWTEEPKHLPAIPFGKHRGMKWAEAPVDYLQWMVRQTDMDRDALAGAERELRDAEVPGAKAPELAVDG